jgi:hypothetical protein
MAKKVIVGLQAVMVVVKRPISRPGLSISDEGQNGTGRRVKQRKLETTKILPGSDSIQLYSHFPRRLSPHPCHP